MDEILLKKSLEMPPSERVAFSEMILASIEQENDDVRKSWITEVKQRMKLVSEGKSQLLDFEDLFSED